MLAGVKFCGGCNPRYDRGRAYEQIKEHFRGRVDFRVAEEEQTYDFLLVIGGCTNNCASMQQYNHRYALIRMWDLQHLEATIVAIEKLFIK